MRVVFWDDVAFRIPTYVTNCAVQFYRRNLPNMQRDRTPHFITFNTKFRRELPGWPRDIVLGCCVHDQETRYRLRVALVMPDHVHLILTPLTNETLRAVVSLVEIMQAIKSAPSHAIHHRVGNHGAIWQEESFEASFVLPRAWIPRSHTSCKTLGVRD